MKILLFDPYPDVKYRVSKDTSGGYGTANDYGDGIIPYILKKLIKKNSNWAPFYAAYTYSALKKNHSIVYTKNIPKNLKDYDLILLCSSIVSYETEIKNINLIRSINSKIKIFAIGPFASYNSDKYLNYNIGVIKGEPEFFFHNNKLKIILSEKIINAEQGDIKLEDLEYPCWQEMGDNFKNINNLFGKTTAVPILATRGCPYSCFKYCVYPLQQGRKVRQRNPKNIVDEIIYWKKKFNVQLFIFRDPVFSINRKHTIELCEYLIKSNVNIKFIIETHLKLLDEELINIMSKAGLKGIKVGVESFSKEVLDEAGRYTVEIDEQIEKIKMIESKKIMVSAMYILGYPEDGEQSILDTINYAIKLNTSYGQFNVWTPYPGTPIFESYKNKLITNKMEDFTQYQIVFEHKRLTKKQVREYMSLAYTKYYSRISWLTKYLKFV